MLLRVIGILAFLMSSFCFADTLTVLAGDKEYQFDEQSLGAINTSTLITKTPWDEAEHTFGGIYLDDFLNHIQEKPSSILAIALDDYRVTIPVADAISAGAFIAFKRDGKSMPVRSKGPFWIIFPFEEADDRGFELPLLRKWSIWQMKTIDVGVAQPLNRKTLGHLSKWMVGAFAIGTVVSISVLAWLTITVQTLNTEIDLLSDQYLDNRPWHLSQLQLEIERMRLELYRLKSSPNADIQYQASLAIELVWSRVDVLKQSPSRKLVAPLHATSLDLLDQILTYFELIEGSLYTLSPAQVNDLIQQSDRWSQEYRSQALRVFDESYTRYQLLSDEVVDRYSHVRSLLVILMTIVMTMIVLLTFSAFKLKVLAKRAQQSSESKSEFLSTMSHELRTPLNGIIGTVELMQLDQNVKSEWLATLSASSEALLAQINDVLDFSRIETGQVLVETTQFNLTQLHQKIESVISPLAIQKGIGLKVQYSDSWKSEMWVEGDSNKLRQILLNLLGNAIKFTLDGEVTLEVTQLKPGEFKWQVSDTGIGIGPDKLQAIFNPFIQAELSTERQFGGTGLGLAISQRLAEVMGGIITVVSDVGVGTSFTLRLPLKIIGCPQQPVDTVIAQSFQDSIHTGRVLVIEDNQVNQTVVSAMLSRLGFDVDIACSGEIGLTLFREGHYRCVFMDIHMPGMDGYECARHIREFDSTTPIVALTANSSEDARKRALQCGMNEFVSKPFRFEHMKQRLDALLA